MYAKVDYTYAVTVLFKFLIILNFYSLSFFLKPVFANLVFPI